MKGSKIVRRIAGKVGDRPITSILNSDRPYVPAAMTNLAETFARLKPKTVIELPVGVTALKKSA